MGYIWIRSSKQCRRMDEPVVEVKPVATIRRDLPYREALDVAIAAFEVAYIDALVQRHTTLAAASRSAGLPVDDLVAIILRPRRRCTTEYQSGTRPMPEPEQARTIHTVTRWHGAG